MAKRTSVPAAGRRPRALAQLAAAEREPQIKLFLSKINQEQIRPAAVAGCDFYASWTKSCCILDFSKLSPADRVSQPLDGLLLRREPDGGMLWNPRNGAVYKLNEVAYHAALDVEAGLSEAEVARRNKLSAKATQSLLRTLRRIA